MKKILNKKELIIILLLIAFLISIPFIIGGVVKVHEWDKPISIDNWLIYYATIGGALIGGFITSVGLYITIKQTREVQNENKKEINIERNINKYKLEIEYLKDLYKESYDYEKYIKNDLEYIFKEAINENVFQISLKIKDISSGILNNINNYNRNIKILSVCVQSSEISQAVNAIKSLESDLIDETKKILLNSSDYDEKGISNLFIEEDSLFYILITLLIGLNTEIICEIEAKKQEFDKLCK
ncbi:hypothetical protein ACSW9O_10635 [Clostridium perfringens]|uniref:hypothetical protein n=1 Tax=Clostridium perfringens TaxID=1502 RepID=UPI001A2B6048|nr:hypothetical protein [Clostridium perfringens]MDU5249228.1 hypothetical protein [Clostridium perfringens]HAT4071310.1 hypothetical protein [Clostridium perfringens]